MITMREPGERIRRKYPASLKKMGKGTLYITTSRVVFESKDYGLCLELHFKWLYEWFPIGRRKCRLSWFEPDPDTKDVRLTDKPFECEIVLERRSDQWLRTLPSAPTYHPDCICSLSTHSVYAKHSE